MGIHVIFSWAQIGRSAIFGDNGYPHDSRADKDPYPHDRCADKDSYPHDSNNQCIILRLQRSFAMINVQLMLVSLISYYSLIFARFWENLQQICVNIIIFICA